MCASSTQSGNGFSSLSSVVESSAATGSVDASTTAASVSQQDSMAEVARQVLVTVHCSLYRSLQLALLFFSLRQLSAGGRVLFCGCL